MDKREQLKEMRKQHMFARNEIRDNEMYTREGDDMRIQMIRDNMTSLLADPEIDPEERKERLASQKAVIEEILDLRDEREHEFIEQELQHHQLEQELEQEIEEEEREKNLVIENPEDGQKLEFRARPFLVAGAEQMRKIIEENRKALNEDEQFSTILINSSEREAIPSFIKSRRKKAEEPQQAARIDTIVIKQREIGMMYRESQELQESQLKKNKPEISEQEEEFEEVTEIEEGEQDEQTSQ